MIVTMIRGISVTTVAMFISVFWITKFIRGYRAIKLAQQLLGLLGLLGLSELLGLVGLREF
jgi:hypothetical protein